MINVYFLSYLECDCGKEFSCTFNPNFWSLNKKCVCTDGYEENTGVCKGTKNNKLFYFSCSVRTKTVIELPNITEYI